MIRKFNEFILEEWSIDSTLIYKNISLKNYGKESMSALSLQIGNFVRRTYKPFGFTKNINNDIDVNGRIMNTEIISKMINNRTVFKKFVMIYNIKSASEFYNTLIDNLYNVYHYDGDFFNKYTYNIVSNTSKRGDKKENLTIKNLINYLEYRNQNVSYKAPSIQQDKSGIDGFINMNGKRYSIQIKPMLRYSKNDENYFLFTKGGMKNITTDWLVLYMNNYYFICDNTDEKIGTLKRSYEVPKKYVKMFKGYYR